MIHKPVSGAEATMTPRRKESTQPPDSLDPESQKRLEAAVMEVFSSVDFHKANIRTVAKKAGVSFSTIYKYYGSKEGL
jgi:AcrR family transcriptional regulator